MSITDELTNMVDSHMIAGLQAEHIMSPTPTCNLLMGLLRKRMGPAGHGVSITDLIEQGDSRWYRGLDRAENRSVNEGTVKHFEEWANLQADIVIAGTQLRQVLGIDSAAVVKADSSLSSFSANQRLTFLDLVGMRAGQAATRGINDIDSALWGDFLPTDNPNRMPITLDQVFDETGPLHGLNPEDLGEWDEKKHVWYDNPINTDGSKYRHIPQIFHNNGTARQISRDVLNYANIRMTASVSGYWLCPLNPALFETLSKEPIPENDRVPLLAGTRWEYKVDCIKYYNTYYYVEQRAPEDRARHIHIGQMNGRDGAFFPLAWMNNSENVDIRSLLLASDPTPNIPGIPLGKADMGMPWFTQEWGRGEKYANAIYNTLEAMCMWICLYRWKMYETRDLEA